MSLCLELLGEGRRAGHETQVGRALPDRAGR